MATQQIIEERAKKIIQLLVDLVELTDDDQQKEFYQDFLDEMKKIEGIK